MRLPRILALVALLLAAPAGAEPLRLDAQAMRDLGFVTLAAGDAPRAMDYAQVLLTRDPRDPVALILAARAARDMGDYRRAEAMARRAWAAADDGGEGPARAQLRYGAAMAMAQALASDGRRGAAQVWLRRAAQIAPDARARAVAERDFRYVRTRNPLSLQFSLSLTPSSNVNNGSRHDTVEIFGLPFALSGDAQALSGLEAGLGLSARWRLAQDERAETHLRLAAAQRLVRLSDKARAQAPGARGRDYAYAVLETGISHRRRLGDAPAVFSLDAAVGHNRYGGRALSDYLRLDLGLERVLTRGLSFEAALGGQRQWRRDAPGRDTDVLSLDLGLVRRLANDDALRLSAGVRDTRALSRDIAHDAVAVGLEWRRAAPVMGVRVAASLSAETRRFGPTLLAPLGRDDRRLEAGLSLTFERLDYMGFAPTLDLRAQRMRSPVALHDGQSLGVAFGIRSVF